MSLSVKDAIESGACSTSIVGGISRQIVREMLLMEPGCLVPVVSQQIHTDSHVNLWLQPLPAAALLHVLAERPGVTLIVNSCLRTLPAQAMLWQQYQEHRCGVTLAAKPGSHAPHVEGIALDVKAAVAWQVAFERHGWQYLGPKDPPHFQHLGGVRDDIGTLSIKAFQTLHNRAHPEHAISIDGAWGPETSNALLASPAGGFTE